MRPYLVLTCSETGKSSANSAGKKSSACFFTVPPAAVPSSITCSFEIIWPSFSVFCANAMTKLSASRPENCADMHMHAYSVHACTPRERSRMHVTET
eukprot:356995-Chlamydomonas_euryale.AAC.19